MKKALCLFIAAITLLLCSSCSERGSGKSITYPLSVSPRTIDPQYTDEIGAQIIINNVFEGLVRKNDDGEIIPGIAEKWEISEDGLTYTFHLKKDTEWYCPLSLKSEYGEDFYKKFTTEKVTADDFVFACRRTVDPATGSTAASRMMVIENASDINSGKAELSSLGVTALDADTVEFRLTEKCDDFLDRLSESEFMPCNEEFFNSMGGRYGLTNKHILCNGPFYVSAWDPETSIIIKSNKYYAGEQTPKPSSVVLSFDSNTDSLYKKLSNGSLSAAFLPAGSEIPENVKVVKEVKNTVYGLVFNCADAGLSNTNIRKALCSSIDRKLFSSLYESEAEQHGIVPESCMAGYVPYRIRIGDQTPEIKQSIADAKKYLQTGLKELNTESLNITMLCPKSADEVLRKQIQVWQKHFGTALNIVIENDSAERISDSVRKGFYQAALTSIESEYDNAVNYLASFNNGNFINLSSKKYAKAVKELINAETDDDMMKACYEAESFLLKNGVCYPLCSLSAKFVISDDAQGIKMPGSENSVCFINARRFD